MQNIDLCTVMLFQCEINVHIQDLVQLYSLALEKGPSAAMFFAENGEAA